jgi:hypothetical protein
MQQDTRKTKIDVPFKTFVQEQHYYLFTESYPRTCGTYFRPTSGAVLKAERIYVELALATALPPSTLKGSRKAIKTSLYLTIS